MANTFFSQFTPDQLRAGYIRNAVGLRTMLAKSERTGKKVGGYTADMLRERVVEYDRLSVASDEAIRTHVSR